MAGTKKKKNKVKVQQKAKLSPERYIKERARKLPIGKCYINNDWKEAGMADIVITRRRPDGNIVLGIFLVDMFCLGVKDVIYRADLDEKECEDTLEKIFNLHNRKKEISCEEAHNIIYGAIEFAEEGDIEPDKTFEVGQYILDEDTEDIPLIEYEYGKDGKHFLINGPSGKELKYIPRLKKKLGDDFDFVILDQFGEVSDYEKREILMDLGGFDSSDNESFEDEEYAYEYPEYPTEASVKHQFIADELLSPDNYDELSKQTIERILALPADEAAEDISRLMLVEIGKTYKAINDETIGDPENGVIMHGLLLLTQLKSGKGLEAVLETLRQNQKFLDYHLGDLAPEFIHPALYACGKDNLKAIESFIYEPGFFWYTRSQATQALAMTAILNPDRRDEVIGIFRRLLKSLVTRLPETDSCDAMFAGSVMSETIVLNAKELIPEIREVFATGCVDPMIAGDAEEVVRSIEAKESAANMWEYEFPDIMAQYQRVRELS